MEEGEGGAEGGAEVEAGVVGEKEIKFSLNLNLNKMTK